MECKHAKYADSHCPELECANYYGRCPKHAPSGRKDAQCSIGNTIEVVSSFDDIVPLVLAIFPHATFGDDNEGQLIIYTDMKVVQPSSDPSDSFLVPFEVE